MASSAVALPADADLDRGGIAGHPKGLSTLFFTEFWERFSYYGMRAILLLFMVAPASAGGLGFDTPSATALYGLYTGSVYFTTIPGGWIADRLLGLRRAVLIGGILIACGHYCLAFPALPTFFAGLLLIVLGTGLLKANISSIVGQLYGEGDPRRDAGFSIFYMGINLGAFLSPFVCGFLGQAPEFRAFLATHFGIQQEHTWHWGFAAAGVGMTFGVVQYVLGQRRLGRAGLQLEAPVGAAALWLKIFAAIVAGSVLLWRAWPYKDYIVLFGTACLFTWLLKAGGSSPLERKRLGAIIVLFVFATLFWSGFEQAGSSLTLFADQNTNNVLFGKSFPSSWYQSVEPMFVISFAPVFAWLWLRLGKHEPSSPAKFAWGIALLGLGFLVIVFAALLYDRDHALVSPWWLVALYLLHAWGELALSPVGLSTVTKLAPQRLVGLMMGVWFLALSLGNFVGGRIAGLFVTLPLPQLFGAVFLTNMLAAVALALLVKPIRKLMGGVH